MSVCNKLREGRHRADDLTVCFPNKQFSSNQYNLKKNEINKQCLERSFEKGSRSFGDHCKIKEDLVYAKHHCGEH